MILSMTGYGRAQKEVNGRDITVELKSVNSRYFEYSSRMPRSFSFLEDRLKKLVAAAVSRGKAELGLTVVNVSAEETQIAANLELAKQYVAAAEEIRAQVGGQPLSIDALSRLPDVFTARHAQLDEEQLWQDVKAVADEAVKNFIAMRAAEGEKLKEDILGRLDTLEGHVAHVEQDSAGRVQRYTDKLYQKLQILLGDRNVDDARILTEAAIFADKTAVDEETVRLHSHIQQYRAMLDLDEPVGRKLDFLTQELNREVNTIGSKCSELDITRTVAEMKGEIEKIREQIQNIE